MTVKFHCVNCGSNIETSAQTCGNFVRCPACKQNIQVPTINPPSLPTPTIIIEPSQKKRKPIGCLGLVAIVFLLFLLVGILESITDQARSPQMTLPSKSTQTKDEAKPQPIELSDTEQAAKIMARIWAGQTNHLTTHDFNNVQDEMVIAYNEATDWIQQQLKSPSTAKFSRLSYDKEAVCVPYGYHQWLCSGWVDAQNSFGGLLRSQWTAYVFRSDVAERIDYWSLGNDIVGKLPARAAFPTNYFEVGFK